MYNSLQIEMVIAAIILLIIIIACLKRSHMSIKYSLAWLLIPIAFILMAIFADPLAAFAKWLGFELLSNFVFFIALALVLMLCFVLTVIVTRQKNQIVELTQELSILKKKSQDAGARKKK